MIADPIVYLWKYYILGIKVSSKRLHLGFFIAIRIWRNMEGSGEGQVSWGLLNIKDELEEA